MWYNLTMAKSKEQVSSKEAIKQIKKIHRDFLSKFKKIESTKNAKIAVIINKAERKQIRNIENTLK